MYDRRIGLQGTSITQSVFIWMCRKQPEIDCRSHRTLRAGVAQTDAHTKLVGQFCSARKRYDEGCAANSGCLERGVLLRLMPDFAER